MASVAGLMPLPQGRIGRAILAWDARPKIFLALALGITFWRLPDAALWAALPLGAAVCALLGGFSGPNLRLWPGGALFVLGWAAVKAGLDLAGGLPASAVALGAGLLAARLLLLLLLGLCLALASSPLRMGRAFAWYLSPFLRGRAWEAALALTLMIHFLPLAWARAAVIGQVLSLRYPGCPWRKRALLVPQALLRTLAVDTWTQTVAVAARGLDGPGAWRCTGSATPLAWSAALLPALALCWAAYF